MQAVILAAGRGTRMKELTAGTPKSMLKVGPRTLLDYKFDALTDFADEIIIVVGYLGSVIHDHYGPDYFGKIRLLYVEQEDPVAGTADALWRAKDVLKDRFLVMNGDNLYAREDIAKIAQQKNWAVLVQKLDHIETGRVLVDGKNHVTGIEENSEHDKDGGWANTGLYLLDRRIFNYRPVPKAAGSKELGLPQTMMTAARDVTISAVPASWWLEIKSPEDLQKAEDVLVHGK